MAVAYCGGMEQVERTKVIADGVSNGSKEAHESGQLRPMTEGFGIRVLRIANTNIERGRVTLPVMITTSRVSAVFDCNAYIGGNIK